MLDLLVKTNDVHFKLRSLMLNWNILALCVLLNSVLIFAISVKKVVAFYCVPTYVVNSFYAALKNKLNVNKCVRTVLVLNVVYLPIFYVNPQHLNYERTSVHPDHIPYCVPCSVVGCNV